MATQRTLVPSRTIRATPSLAGGGQDPYMLVDEAYRAISKGSRSFAMASKLFDSVTRENAWLLYAWCRRCDDIADAQDMGGRLGGQENAPARVKAIRALTTRALDGYPTADPAFDGFGMVASEVGITEAMADDLIEGFELDAQGWKPETEADMLTYCYHVAGSVGVMMARVMRAPRDEWLLDRACDLGLAFQLANIARDVVEDWEAGRCYLPAEWLAEAGIPEGAQGDPAYRQELAGLMQRHIALMEQYEAAARLGAAQLTFRNRWAVLAAARIYGAIGRKVRRRGAKAWKRRARIGKAAKLRHVTAAFFEASRNKPHAPARMPALSRGDLAPVRENDGWDEEEYTGRPLPPDEALV